MLGSVPLRFPLCVALLCIGCGDDGNHNNGGSSHTQIKPQLDVDLAHVIGFAIADTPSPRLAPAAEDAGTCNPSTLYAVEDSGALVVTTVTETVTDDDAGTTQCNTSMMTERATKVIDTPKYVVIDYFPFQVGGGDAGMTTCGGVILRKSDGALFCLTDSALDVKADSTDNNLLVAGAISETAGMLLTRLNMALMPPTATPVIDATLNVHFPHFDANSDGDALVPFSMVGPPNALRVYKVAGGLQNILAQGEECQWAHDHDFFYAYHDMTLSNPPLDVYQLARQGDGSFMASKVGSMTNLPFCQVALVTPTQTYAFNWGSGGAPQNEIVELIGSSAGTAHLVPGMNKIVDAIGVDNAIFVQGTDNAGNGIIVREDVPAFTATTLLPAGDFSLTAISVSKTGELTFAGLRNSDAARVVGNVAAGASTYTILSATAPMVSDLQRIN
jgi:hypothetical protein